MKSGFTPAPGTVVKKLKIVLLILVISSVCSARADYPIVSHRYAADPAAMEFNGRLYVYCSNDDENGTNGYWMSSITCFSTDDLKNWTDHGVVFRANTTSWASLTWAPSAVSNQSKVYLYFANGAGSIGVATSSVPTGPFADARGSSLINGSTPGASTSTQWLFDPCAFIDTDGQAYVYFGGQYPTNARVISLSANLTSVSGSASPVFATNLFEASYMHKRNGIYYYTYCNRFEFGAAIYCETNSNPTTGFIPQGTVLANPPQNVNNNNHHSIVSYIGNWYIVYHNRAAALANGLSNSDAVYKRSLCLDALNYNADGSIQQVTPTTDGVTQLKNLDPYKRVEAETIARQSGIKTEVCSEGGMNVTSVTNGSWIRIRGVDFGAGAVAFYARVASAGAGGNIELRLDSLAGTLVGACAVAPTGGWQTWTTVTANVSGAAGVHDLYLKFIGGAGDLFSVNWWQFQFGGGTDSASPLSFEAESGALGADWAVSNSVSPALTNITIIGTGAGGNPGSAARVATYTAKFPAAGTYELYARLRTGAGTFNDDSMFYGNGFGVKSATTDNDWMLVNGLAAGGFTAAGDAVAGNGSAGSQVWKWVNLSQFLPSGSGTETPITFTVPAGNLTQTFQIGAREDGLDFDKFAFAPVGYAFTVAALDADGPGTAPTPTVTISLTNLYQIIEGFGGAIAFYNGWVTAHPYKDEILTNAFAGLNLSMLRLGNWFRYQGVTNFDPDAPGFVAKANQVLGRPVQVFMSSWAPPAFLKSNGQVGNGGTLLYTNGGFAYNAFAQYWYDSLVAYRNIGVSPNWISIQNEPDWEASYDSCIFRPTEGMYNGTNWAGYSNALSATFLKVATLPSPPKFLGPEPVGIGYSVPQNYAVTMNTNHFYGFNYHLYHGSTDGSANGYINSLRATTNLFPAKPRFMTEFGVSNMIESATLIHNCLTEGQVSGYNHWSLIWPNTDGGLIQIEFPWNQAQWTNAPPGTPTQSKGYWLSPSYWAMKHFSYYITPGSRRIAASSPDANVKVSAYLTPDNLRLVAVFINRSTNSATMDLNFAAFPFASSSVYQTAGTNKFQSLGAAGAQLTMPGESLTTVVLDKFVNVGPASNPSPADGVAGVALSTGLNWTVGSNAVVHAVYLGVSSNAVFAATPVSVEFKGYATNNSFTSATLYGSSTYYWRVDEIAGGSTNTGIVWSFSTVAAPALAHRYSFSEIGGNTVTDSDGGPAWNGTVFNGGSLAGGQLTLASASSQYVNLPPGIVSTLSNFTITAWVRLNSAAGWARIFDFGNNTTSYMFLTPTNGGAGGRLRFGITTNSAGGEQQITGPTALSVGGWHHVAVTLNGNTGILYLNGVPQATNASMTLKPFNLGNTANNYLGRSQWSDPYFNGHLDEFRIYSVAHSAAEIAAMYALGPNQLLSSASPPLRLAATPTTLTLTWPLESAGFTVQSRTNLMLGNWVNVPSPAPQIISGQWQVTLPVSASSPATFFRLLK
ncbi:MAG: carbohydrate-binding protein [Verrucomicrobiota bacterium]